MQDLSFFSEFYPEISGILAIYTKKHVPKNPNMKQDAIDKDLL
jgi:hypothetical protein